MAQHIKSIRESSITQMTKGQFYSEIQPGDYLFCQGNYDISKAIEDVTDSPFSHVLMCWVPSWADQWLTLEATSDKGVHIGLLSDYIDLYEGDLILARREAMTLPDVFNQLNYGLTLLDNGYDWQQEVRIAAHRLCPLFPVKPTTNRLFCSGLMEVMSHQTPVPLQPSKTPGAMCNPDEVYTDPSVTAVCSLVK